MVLPLSQVEAYRRREAGLEPNGTVDLRAFDLGMVTTLGGVEHTVAGIPGYYVGVEGVEPAPGLPGVQIVFGDPDDAFANYLFPMYVMTRNDFSEDMARWHPGHRQYRAPRSGEEAIQVAGPGGTVLTGYKHMEEAQQAIPHKFTYTLTIAHERRGRGNFANQLMLHARRIFQPYCTVDVVDSVGDVRAYFAQAGSVSPMDEVIDVADRVIGWTIDIEVEGELDLNSPQTYTTATGRTFNYTVIQPTQQVVRFRRKI